MPTFDNPLTDAADSSEALRVLLHGTRVFEDPAGTYMVLGDFFAGVRAHDDTGDPAAGATHALGATAEL